MVSFKHMSLCAVAVVATLASPVPGAELKTTSTAKSSTSHSTSSAAKATSKTTSSSHKTTSTTSHKSTTTTKTTCTTSTSTYTALYDNISAAPGVPNLNAVPSPYMGLYYNAFNVNDAGVAGTTIGVIPESTTNVIVTAAEQVLLDGTASISSNYAGSVLSSFTLTSAYFGCVVNSVESLAGAATACTITVTPNGGTAQQFTFTPTNVLAAPMQKITFSSAFQKISSASFNITVSNATPALTALFLDNVAYKTYASCS